MDNEKITDSVGVSSKNTTQKGATKGTSRTSSPTKTLKGSLDPLVSDTPDQQTVKNNVKVCKRKRGDTQKTDRNTKQPRKKPKKSAKRKGKPELKLRETNRVRKKSVKRLKRPGKSDKRKGIGEFRDTHTESLDKGEADYNTWRAHNHTQTSIQHIKISMLPFEHFALLLEEYYLQQNVSYK